MEITKVCECCGKTFTVPHWRSSARYCSRKCSDASRVLPPNVVCTNCGKSFRMKKYQQERYNRNCGYFCSRKCFAEYKKVWFVSDNNHQYGLKGNLNSSFKNEDLKHKNHNITDILVYFPQHPYADKNGRVFRHRLVAEQNSKMFNDECFEVINGITVLKRDFVVHHKDGNHNNDDISNLEVMTIGEHASLHNKLRDIPRDKRSGRFISKKVI